MSTHRLPACFPIFPLPNVVLFPDARLPLHIFEPRYRQMTEDALRGERVIGMVLLASADSPEGGLPPVFEVGCAGRILESQPLPDGRSNILLEGVRRFRIEREEPTDKLYRVARVALLDDPGFEGLDTCTRSELEAARAQIEAHLLQLAQRTAPAAVEPLRERMQRLDPVQLVHALAFGLDGPYVEKQSLLEAPDPLARCQLLIRLLEFRRLESRLPRSPRVVN